MNLLSYVRTACLLAFFSFSTYASSSLLAQCCGDFSAYAINNSLNQLVGVDLATGTQTNIASITQQGFVSGGEIIDCVYYVGSDDGNLYAVDLETGVFTTVITGCSNAQVTALEVDPVSGKLFGLTRPEPKVCGNGTQLIEIDLENMTCSTLGPVNTEIGCGLGLIIDATGTAYVIDPTGDDITPISLSDGSSEGVSMSLGLDLIAVGQDYVFDCPLNSDLIFGYIFDGPTRALQYISIDPSTGTTELVNGNLGSSITASFAVCAEEVESVIPTMGQWTLIILGLVTMSMAVVAIKKQRNIAA